jgi:hypothetical protein
LLQALKYTGKGSTYDVLNLTSYSKIYSKAGHNPTNFPFLKSEVYAKGGLDSKAATVNNCRGAVPLKRVVFRAA